MEANGSSDGILKSPALLVLASKCDQHKKSGNEKLKSGDVAGAVKAYTKALAIANNACAVQIFDVAFSRRMCCSRVCMAKR